MRRILIFAAAALAFAASAAARTLVNQDFERVNFPPKNWDKYGTNPEWGDWVRKGGGNHYAAGTRVLTRMGRGLEISLLTNSFFVRAEREITITFRYSAWRTRAAPNDSIMILFRQRDGGYGPLMRGKRLPYSKPWQRYKWVLPPLKRDKYYRFEFRIWGYFSSGEGYTVYFNVDDVRATCCPPAVDPTSLGRVKALFR